MTTRADGDRLLRAAVVVLSAPGWGLHERKLAPLFDVVESIAPGRVDRARKATQRAVVAKAEAARWSGNPPAWAKRLMNEHAPAYTLTWRVSRSKAYTSGHTYAIGRRIVVTVGPDVDEQKAVVLHEIAHARTPRHSHDEQFWDEFLRLARAEHHVGACRDVGSRRSFDAAMRRARRGSTVRDDGAADV